MREYRRSLKFPRILAGFTIAVVLLLLLEAVWLGGRVLERLDDLSIAQTDNFQWNLNQIEVEHLKVENIALSARQGEDLVELRRKFDVFYSRIITVRESRVFGPLREDQDALLLLKRIQSRLDEMATFVDGSDDLLLNNIPSFQQTLLDNRHDIRRLALAGLSIYSGLNEARRLDLHALLSQLAAVVFVLVTALMATAVLLAGLYQRGQTLATEKGRAAAKLQAMVASSLDAVLVVGRDGRVLDYNGAAEAVFGYTRDEALGADMGELIVPDHLREAHRKGFDRFLKTGQPKVLCQGRVELDARRKSGEVFPVELSLSASQSGEDAVFVGYLRDISDRYAAEEELRRARDDALAGERAKSKLLTVMSHEMRTPLTGILGAVDLLDAALHDEAHKRALQAMRLSGELLLQHVNDVLELSSLETGSRLEAPAVFDLEQLVETLVEGQQASAQEAGNELSVFCSLGVLPTVVGQPRALQQILLNLVGNALKFTQNGAVLVDVCRVDGSDQVEIQVADTGKGVAPEHLEQIFEDFVRLDASYGRASEGTGLGLAITQRLVHSMGGTISCESTVGEGSIFVITVDLPAARAPRPTPERTELGQSDPVQLLIVEDNDINRELLQQILQKMGHTVTAVSGGAEAIEVVANTLFDLVLMDISMPEVDGIEAIRRIRSQNLAPETEIVALTAHAAPEDHRVILEAGFAEVLTKPVSKAALADVIVRRSGCVAPDTVEGALSDLAQFFEALGADRARLFLKEFQCDIATFRGKLGVAPVGLTDEVRAEAHRLAGSAAVLGLSDLRQELLNIEVADETAPPEPSKFDVSWEQAELELQSHL